jgi:hypothetical protein
VALLVRVSEWNVPVLLCMVLWGLYYFTVKNTTSIGENDFCEV